MLWIVRRCAHWTFLWERLGAASLISTAAIAGCGRTPVHELGAGNAQDASTSTLDGGTATESTALTGWWMKQTGGNCIDLETWLVQGGHR